MPIGKLRQDFMPLPTPAPMPQLTANVDGAAATPSPARALQQQLEHRALGAQSTPKWSERRALAFIVASSCALWMGLLLAGAQVVRLIA